MMLYESFFINRKTERLNDFMIEIVKMIKRYAIFAGETYYASGGIEDLACVCNDLEKAERIYDQLEIKLNNRPNSDNDSGWLQLFDLLELKMIRSFNCDFDNDPDSDINISSDDDSADVKLPFD